MSLFYGKGRIVLINGTFTRNGHLDLGGTVLYLCHSGYEMVGQPNERLIMKCMEGNIWSPPLPKCSRKCRQPDLLKINFNRFACF